MPKPIMDEKIIGPILPFEKGEPTQLLYLIILALVMPSGVEIA